MRKILTLLTLCYACGSLAAQDYLVSQTYLGTRTKLDLLLTFGVQVDYDIDLYKITYQTPGSDQLPDTASGLMVLPKVPAGTPLPIVMFEHGTTSGPTDVPSQLRGGYEAAMAYAAFGFITLAPDYLGLGDSRGFHPYVHAATEASASLDMLNAGLEYLDFNEPEWNPNYLFLSGYSQGGHASMALHREIQDFWSFVYPVTAATHMSGPYSLSGVMKDLILSDESYGNPAYIAYIVLGYEVIYDLFDSVGDIFKEPYAADIDSFYQGQITLGTLNSRLLQELALGGNTVIKRMLHDSIVNILENVPDDPINLALLDNDTYNWAPEAPTRLYYCGADEQVPFENSIIAGITMNSLGAPDTEAVNLSPVLDHGGCVLPALVSSIAFFQSFLSPSAVADPWRSIPTIDVMPNPTSAELLIGWEQAQGGMTYRLYDGLGAQVDQGLTTHNRIQVQHLPAGIYTVLVTVDHESRLARFVRL